jgi:hypothetical protein
MTRGNTYRVKAAEFIERAKAAMDPTFRVEHARMAAAYLRLAEQADRKLTPETMSGMPPAQKPSAR